MVILHPDLLLSGTRVTGNFRCQRQSVLEERFAGSSNDKAVEGTLMHEVFQVTLCHGLVCQLCFAMCSCVAMLAISCHVCCVLLCSAVGIRTSHHMSDAACRHYLCSDPASQCVKADFLSSL